MILKMIIGLENIPKTKKDVVIIVDAFRSSGSIINAFKHGVKKILLFNSVTDINNYLLKGKSLSCGEENGFKPEHFDLGNSPDDYSLVKNKTLLFTSGFGAKALLKANAKKVYLAGIINSKYVSDYLIKYHSNNTIYFVVDGKVSSVCLDDFLCAGLIISYLGSKNMDVGCKLATNFVLQYRNKLIDLFYTSPPVLNLINKGFKKDVDYKSGFLVIPFYLFSLIENL